MSATNPTKRVTIGEFLLRPDEEAVSDTCSACRVTTT
jgi:hypothetical protein